MRVAWNKGLISPIRQQYNLDNTRRCPDCNTLMSYTTFEGYSYGVKNNAKCQHCKSSGKNNGQYGVVHDEEYKKEMSKRLQGDKNPMYGKTGKDHPAFGYKHTLQTKEIIRRKVCERMLSTGGVPDVDVGAIEYFNEKNKNGHNIKHPNIFIPCGDFVDGYDEENHIVYECDTP